MTGQLVQMLCGRQSLFDEIDGIEVRRPHALQWAPGRCVHEITEAWNALLRRQSGRYLGMPGDAEWPMHAWEPAGHVSAVAELWAVRDATPLEPKVFKEDKSAEYRREVWTGTGVVEPVTYDALAMGRPEARAVHPHPAVDSRSGLVGPSVGVVDSLASEARSAGWSVAVTYARGHGIHAGHGGVLAERESWAVRGVLDGRRFVAVREGDTWGSVWMISPELRFFGGGMITDLKEWVAARGVVQDPLWRDHLAALAEGKTRAAKIVKCPGTPRCGRDAATHTHRANGDIRDKVPRKKVDHGF